MKTWSLTCNLFYCAIFFLAAASRAANSLPAGSHFAAEYANVPIHFEANLGQADSSVEFLAHGQNGNLLLTASEAWLTLQKHGEAEIPGTLRLKLSGANTGSKPEGLDPLPAKANYFYGKDSSRWRTDVPTFAQVKYHDVYPGVDLVYYGNQQQLEFDFVLRPGADPDRIKLDFSGADKITLDASGDLLLCLGTKTVRQHKPVVYQEIAGTRKMLSGNYVLHSEMQVGFEVGDFDKTKPLIIDPVLGYSATFGGTGLSQTLAIALDGNDNVYITGNTTSSDFQTMNPFQTNLLGAQDAFVVKFDTNGAVVYSTYLGGGVLGDSSITSGQGITVDVNGDVFLAGYTSSLTNFPTKNPLQSTNASLASPPFNAFVTEINSNGNALVYSTYLGGKGTDAANSLALDTNADAIITGYTTSTNFPTVNAAQPVYGGNGDAFVAKLTADGSALVYSTYLGGSKTENIPSYWTNPNASGGAVAVDFSGNAYVTGWTYSTNFPVLNAFQTTNAGTSSAAFVTELDPFGNLVYSTYFGGKSGDYGRAIGVDFNDNVYFAGNDAGGGLPTTNALQSSFGGKGGGYVLQSGFTVTVGDGFVAALDATGTNLIYSTYLGGSGDDQVNGIAVRPEDGTVAVTGFTDSPNFPLLNPIQPAGKQGFFTSSNSASVWSASSPVPGDGIVYEIHVDPSNPSVIYAVAGVLNGTDSSDYAGVYRSTDGGNTWTWMSSLGTFWSPSTHSSNGNAISSIMALDPLNPGTLYVGIGTGANFYKTTNRGTNWNYIKSLQGGPIQSLAIDPVTTTTIYAGTSSKGVYKSLDGGNTWNEATNGLNNLDIQALLVDPQNSANVYAGVGGGFGSNPSLFRSTNGGTNWNLTTNGLASQPVAGLAANAGAIYAILGDAFDSASLFRSTDGLNWTQLVADNTLDFTALAFATSSGGLPALTIGRSGTNDIMSWPASFTGYTLQFTAALNPSKWQNVAQSPVTNNGSIVVTIPMAGSQGYYRLSGTNGSAYSPPAIYLGTDQVSLQGLLKSVDGGVTWTSAGFAGNTVNALAVNPANAATIYAGLNRGRDAFVATLTPAGQLYFSSYIGGSGADQGNSIAQDFLNAYMAGSTSSPDFPTTVIPAVVPGFKIPPVDVKPNATGGPPVSVEGSQKSIIDQIVSTYGCPMNQTFTVPGTTKDPIGFEYAKHNWDAIFDISSTTGNLPDGVKLSDPIVLNGDEDSIVLASGTPQLPGTYTYAVNYIIPSHPPCLWTNTYIIIIK